MIPVITLWQPWASLIFSGDKLHETRAFAPPAKYLGRRIAIHAAKALPSVIPGVLDGICMSNWGEHWRDRLPRGAILGTVALVGVTTTEAGKPLGDVDRLCGDWTAGRFAWQLEMFEQLPTPILARGKQGWWSIDEELLT